MRWRTVIPKRKKSHKGRLYNFPTLLSWPNFQAEAQEGDPGASLLDFKETEAARMFRAEYQKDLWIYERGPGQSLAKYWFTHTRNEIPWGWGKNYHKESGKFPEFNLGCEEPVFPWVRANGPYNKCTMHQVQSPERYNLSSGAKRQHQTHPMKA